MTFSRLVHPLEYSDAGMKAAADAVTFAGAYQAELHVVDARPRRVSQEGSTHLRLLNFIAEMDTSASTLRAAVVYGDPVAAVAEYVRSTAPDLVVVGRTGRRGSVLWRAGVFAKELASLARCPTLVLPSGRSRPATDTWLFKNILCAVDSSRAAAAASQFALDLAQHSGSQLTTFNVVEGAHSVGAKSRDEAIVATTGRLDRDLILRSSHDAGRGASD